jgi:ectoine hydroxylase-related dioxygenase (phytanoyl-CoA dioxygenase family)
MQDGIALIESLGLDFARLAEGAQHDPALAARCAAIARPVELAYGEFLAFDPRCVHATQFNRTAWTRISLDFRVVPLEDYRAMRLVYRGTGRRQMLFKQGHYYDARDSRAL